MRRIVVALAAGLFLGTISSAHAGVTLNGGFYFTITSSQGNGISSITDPPNPESTTPQAGFGDLSGTSQSVVGSGNQISFTNAPLNTPLDLASIYPSSTCGTGCSNYSGASLQTDSLTITFNGLQLAVNGTPTGTAVNNIQQSATFEALYDPNFGYGSGQVVTCAQGDGISSAPDTDCVLWGSTTTAKNTQSTDQNVVIPVSLPGTGGDTLNITLYNASDWQVTPYVEFQLTTPSGQDTVVEPASLALFATGLTGLGLIRRRRNAAR